ncbi:PTS sugar transporter subunit IIA, partial [Streptococcus suis]|uniref:PTS sugar transporter subunit IIA n=1 Tax=Streptococcus suis TaxID=1307 RepID=UPI00137A4F05
MNLQKSFTENNSIRLGLTAETWQEAVHLAVEPLIDSGAATEEYYDAIIDR